MEEILTTNRRVYLTSYRSVYKTEGFFLQTRKILQSDAFLEKVSEAIFAAGIGRFTDRSVLCETVDKSYSLFFRFGGKEGTEKDDLLFYKFLSRDRSDRANDRQIVKYLTEKENFDFTVKEVSDEVGEEVFSKLYLLSGDDKSQFPRLTPYQKSILETEDKNVLVQGVAGSGKTNLCIEKIVYCACRGYRGRLLYTTFSRGLLVESMKKVNVVKDNIKRFIESYEKNEVVFLDQNHKKAVENRLGISLPFDKDEDVVDALKKIVLFLDKNVDFFLPEDLYAQKHGRIKIADERVFLTEYASSGRASGLFDKVRTVSSEIAYKEIFGMIYGKYEPTDPSDMLLKEEYCDLRKESFSRAECEAIYNIALDYGKFLTSKGYLDNNGLSRVLIDETTEPVYSIGVVDETQDFTQVTLYLLKKLCRKLFCVGDAQQMINPSYFSFAYLKRLLYGEVTGVAELKHNFRNAERIEKIVEKIGDLNVKRFGTHSFVLRGQSVGENGDASATYVCGDGFLDRLAEKRFDNLTIIVSSASKKEELRKKLKNVEILTVSEAKGLERNAVVLADVLSDSADKWKYLTAMVLNRKTADENSVFRYYYNLFYVGVTRAKRHLFVVEREQNPYFAELFKECFDQKSISDGIKRLSEIAGKTELDDDELLDRIRKFAELSQYENAYFTADRLSDDALRERERAKIFVHERFIKNGDYRGAGMEYWKRGYDDEAKEMFRLSGDEAVIPLIDACRHGGRNLDYQIVKFLPLVAENAIAREVIIETMKTDAQSIFDAQKEFKGAFKAQRSKK